MKEPPRRVVPVILIRKSRKGPSAVIRDHEFPFRFRTEGGKGYVVERTRSGGVILKAE